MDNKKGFYRYIINKMKHGEHEGLLFIGAEEPVTQKKNQWRWSVPICSALVRPHLKYSVQFCTSQNKGDMGISESPVKGLNNDYGTRVSFTQGKAKSIHCSEWISERPKGSYPCG